MLVSHKRLFAASSGRTCIMTISCVMIVKNEENILARCLDSIKDLMDEIVIVDTGSTDKTKDIARKYTGNIYDVVVPAELSGYPVTSLSDILFQHNSFVRSVNLPETITRIADYSFANMSELRSVILPETLTEIGTERP